MIIEKITINSFGHLSNLSLDFSESVNVIEGQNEAGKSTIAAFIKYMLYGFEPTEEAGAVGERKKRINWDTGIAEGSMNVSVKGKKYLINRSTAVTTEQGGRTSYKEESSIIDLENGTPAFGKLPAGEVFFGVDRELFENTAFLGQLGDTAIKESTVKESIENILFSGNEKVNTQKASNLIALKMDTLLHQGNTGGAIIDLMKKQEELEERLRCTDEDNKQILAKEAELHEIKAKREAAEIKRDKFLELDCCFRNVMLIQTFDQLHELEEECQKRTDTYNTFIKENTKCDFVPTAEYLTDIALARRGIEESYKMLVAAQDLYSKEKNAVGITKEIESAIELSDTMCGECAIKEKVNELEGNKLKSLIGGIGALTAFLASAIAAIAIPPIGAKIALVILALLALGGAGALGYIYFKAARAERTYTEKFSAENAAELKAKLDVIAEARLKRDTIIGNTQHAKDALEAAKKGYEDAKTTLAKTYMRWNELPPTGDINTAFDELEERVRTFLSTKAKLLEDKNTVEITVKEIRRTLADKSEIDIRAQVSPLRRKSLSQENYDDIISGIAEAKAVIEEQQRLSFTVENELAALKLRASDPGELYSKIQAIDAKINELRAKHKAYFVALRALDSASDNLRAEISPRLGEYATELLEIMTDKKYTSLAVDDSLKVNFKTESGQNKSVDYLSGGTRDLTYIALRMALIDMLYTEKPPICFDETFASQDNVRADSMMKAIGKLSGDGYQSFIFTCRAREATLAQQRVKNAGIFRLSVTAD